MGLPPGRAVTILEFQSFRKDADTLFSVEELDHLRVTLACAPRIGDLIPGTGGVRKLRWGLARRGQGKRGGARVIYYFHSEAMPLALIAVYAKGEKATLTASEKAELRGLVTAYVSAYGMD